MNNIKYLKLSDVSRSNLKQGKEFLYPAEIRKIKIKENFDSRRKQLLTNWELQEKRLLKFKKSRKIEKLNTIAKNKIKTDDIKFRIAEIKDLEYHKRLDLVNKLKKKEKKAMVNLKNLKRSAFAKKLEKDYNRYWGKIDTQTRILETNKLLIERCVDHINPTVEEEENIDEIGNENEEIEKESESSEHCNYTPVSSNIIKFNPR